MRVSLAIAEKVKGMFNPAWPQLALPSCLRRISPGPSLALLKLALRPARIGS